MKILESVTLVVFLQLMLKSGADVNYRFASLNTTALMTTSFHGHVDILQTLLNAGADVKATDLQQSTALGYAFGGEKSVPCDNLILFYESVWILAI